jgi:competence protein ComEC
LLAAVCCGLVWWRAERVAAPRLERVTVASFSGRILAVEPLAARETTRITLAPIDGALPPRVRVNVPDDVMITGIAPGDTISVRARLLPPPPAAVPGAYDFARVAWFAGLGATGQAAHIRAQAPGAAGGIADALASGNQGAIPQADADAMRRSGLAHLLSVSGLHVTAAVAATMLLVLRLLALSPTLALRAPLLLIAAGAGAIAAIGYTLLTGAEVPTVRSCVAALLVLAGLALGREAMTLRLVAAGALIVLLLWPEALAGPSFQMSFAAVAAIVVLHEHPRVRALLQKRDERWPRRLARELGGLLLTGFVVEAVLMPIAVFHFHRAGAYGAVANIVAIPLTTFVVMPLEALALFADLFGLGAPFWWLTVQALDLLLWIAHRVGDAPGAVSALPSMPWGAFALIIGGALWFALWRKGWRWVGLVPFALGGAWAIATPPPDILITGDGRHLAVRGADGGLALLRPRAGDYVRGLLGESAGVMEEAGAIDELPGARCGPDLCATVIARDGRRWTLLATRSVYAVDSKALERACAGADIVVSERRLPRGCRPRWLKVDRAMLERTGGLAIRLASGEIERVREAEGEHLWATKPPS